MGNFDFSGWATRNDLLCADGRTIRKDAFIDNDGQEVPLVWNHQHASADNVLGHALLENRSDGVYAYCTFNDTESGQAAKKLVQHGDVRSLSIYANKLKQIGGDVIHGSIRELSLVLAGANPGAKIDFIMAHGEDEEDAFIAEYDENIMLYHAACAPKKEESKEEPKEEPKKKEPELEHSKEEPTEGDKKMAEENKEKTVADVFDELTEEQKTVVYAMIGQALEEAGADKTEGEDGNMKHNLFDAETVEQDTLMHDAMNEIIADGKRYGSLKESFLAHADAYGITNIDYLFPDNKNITNEPGFIKRNPDAWVDTVMAGVHHTPFSRIKMMFADITEDEARAKGYTKGKLKKEEVFSLLKRTVDPTTIYKKQKLDRDDIVDITDFDVVAWLKGEMRMMLDEEIARAILFGDGRTSSSQDKINESKIIPIAKDAALYTIVETLPSTYTAKDVIKAAVKSQDTYEGSGNITMFVANTEVTDMLLVEDTNQHRLYKDVNELAMACNVSKIVKVPASIIPTGVKAVLVDLRDYNVGADKGGSVNMFDDFDIDYNQQKYLIETRCSGALTKPYSAIVIKEAATQAAG